MFHQEQSMSLWKEIHSFDDNHEFNDTVFAADWQPASGGVPNQIIVLSGMPFLNI